MSSPLPQPDPSPAPAANWEAFYASYKKPGYIPGFEITSKLGGGMFGIVFKATRQSIGKDYAIKFLRVDDGDVRRAVLQELEQVRYFAQIDHPNLVSIEDKGEVDGIPYLVMAYAGAETLRSLLPGDESSRPELLRLFLQACRGVAALHERSLVHFDLKPANVFLKGGVARVGDYGLSKLVTHSRGSLSMGRGTPYYMAPEMLQRRGDHRSDIYSLGVLLFEVLTGDVPFKGDSEWEVLKQHEKAEIVFPPHVGERERAVVRRCMHKDPAGRFQSVHEILAAFGAPSSVGGAAFQDARTGMGASTFVGAGVGAAAGAGSTASAPPPPPPPPNDRDDPYAGFRKASRDAYTHANKIARDAMQKARDVAQQAMKQAMKRSRKQHARRAHAWVRWWRMERDRRRRLRDIARQERRARWQRRSRVLGVFLAVMMFVGLVLSLVMPATVRIDRSGEIATVAVAPEMPVVPIVAMPEGLQIQIRRGQPTWIRTARQDVSAAKAQLDAAIARFEAQAPLSPERLRDVAALPSFGPIQGIESGRYQRAAELIDELQQAPEYDDDVAQQARAVGVVSLYLAAQQLTTGTGGNDAGSPSQAAQNLNRFLSETTGFKAIQLTTDERLPPSIRMKVNDQVGKLWLWYLYEMAGSIEAWDAYQQLRWR